MENRTIIIQTNTTKRGKLDQRSFACQVYEYQGNRIYMLDDTKSDLIRKHFTITTGCRIIDNGVTYLISNIQYSPRPIHPCLTVNPKNTV